MKVRAHIFLTGMVQGVSFRSSTRTHAKMKGVSGWIRNLSDGRVESIMEGDKESVESLIEFCKQGPKGSNVDDIRIEWEKPRGDFGGFDIRS